MKDGVVAVILCVVVFCLAAGGFYACTVVPMEECMDEGHSLAYCHRLLNK